MKKLFLFVLIPILALSNLIGASDTVTDYISARDYEKIAEYGVDKSFTIPYSNTKYTPISYAIRDGWTEEELLGLFEIGLDVNTSFTYYGSTYTILKYALYNLSPDFIVKMIELGLDPDATANCYGSDYSIIKYALTLGDWDIDDIIKLINAGVDPYTTFSWYGLKVNILQYLVFFSDWELDDIVMLIESGIDPNTKISCYNTEMTIIDYLIAYEHWNEEDIIRLVNAGARASKTVKYYGYQYDIDDLTIEKGYSADLGKMLKDSSSSSSKKETTQTSYPAVSIDANKLVDETINMIFGKDEDSSKKQEVEYDVPSWMIGSWATDDSNYELKITEKSIYLVSYGVSLDLIQYCNSLISIYGDTIPMEIKVKSVLNSCSIVLESSFGISISVVVFSKNLAGKLVMTMDSQQYIFTKK